VTLVSLFFPMQQCCCVLCAKSKWIGTNDPKASSRLTKKTALKSSVRLSPIKV
jgi:hypothetical protein